MIVMIIITEHTEKKYVTTMKAMNHRRTEHITLKFIKPLTNKKKYMLNAR